MAKCNFVLRSNPHVKMYIIHEPIALADKYKSLYPLSSIRLNNLATPLWAHALPTIGIIWPSTSDLKHNPINVNSNDVYQFSAQQGPFGKHLLCNRAIDIGNHYFIVISPQKQSAFTPSRTLIRSSHTEHHFIWSGLQIQIRLQAKRHVEKIDKTRENLATRAFRRRFCWFTLSA